MNDTRISELRRARGWTQERLAEQTGVTVRTIQRLEAGNDASLETLSLVAKALQVPVRDLFGTVEENDFGKAVDDLDGRTTRQQERRDAVTRGYRSLYRGIGIVLTLAVAAMIASNLLPSLGIFIIPAYWAGGRLLSAFLLSTVIDPRLDAKYPLSRAQIIPAKSRFQW